MDTWREIYSYEDLESIIKNGKIEESFWVNSTEVNKLLNVRKIQIGEHGSVYFKNLSDIGILESIDCDFSFFGNIESLKNLKYVGGTLRFGAPVLSLNNLEEVKGDLRPTTNELRNLGKLRMIGGTADFRGMVHLLDLTPLKEVGGNLNLVNSLKGKYKGLDKIKVGGRIIYWKKEPSYYFEKPMKKFSPIPIWKNLGFYEFENGLVFPTKEQLQFYNLFKKSFLEKEFLDIGGMQNYVRYLIFDLFAEYNQDHDFSKLIEYFETIKENYAEYAYDCENIEVKIGRNLGIKKYIDFSYPYEIYMSWDDIVDILSQDSDEKLIDALKRRFVKNTNITNYGRDNIEKVLVETISIIREYEKRNSSLLGNMFFDQNKYYKTEKTNEQFDPNFYKKFYDTEENFLNDLKIHNERNKDVPTENIAFPKYLPMIVELSFNHLINRFLREGENIHRDKNNLPRIGEGWISETELYYKLKEAFKDCEIIPQGRPFWLGLQRFDIYFPKYNIAIEYQGPQHYEPIEIFGGKEGLRKTIENDQRKRELCEKNNCTLIEVLPGYDFDELRNEIARRISEI